MEAVRSIELRSSKDRHQPEELRRRNERWSFGFVSGAFRTGPAFCLNQPIGHEECERFSLRNCVKRTDSRDALPCDDQPL
jgi:hypothetical protein